MENKEQDNKAMQPLNEAELELVNGGQSKDKAIRVCTFCKKEFAYGTVEEIAAYKKHYMDCSRSASLPSWSKW